MSIRPVVFALVLSVALQALPVTQAQGSGAASNDTIIYNFKALGLGGFFPSGGFVADPTYNLYGTGNGGTFNAGVVFKLRPNGDGSYTKSIIYNFHGLPDGGYPRAPLVFDAVGDLYGTLNEGGLCNSCGAVFELSPQANGTWKETTLHQFSGGGEGDLPTNGLIIDKAGNLYGTTDFLFGPSVVYQLSPASGGTWAYNVLHTFDGSGGDGLGPNGLVIDTVGNLYGTTQQGGTIQCFGQGCGMAFELSPGSGGNWNETILYNWNGSPDGFDPYGAVTFDAAGNLYGTTNSGGTGTNCGVGACGTVFKLTPLGSGHWSESTLYSFQGNSDGIYPNGWLVFDSAGNLYGATEGGGGVGNCSQSCGIAFELSPTTGGWQESVLWRFTGGQDGRYPSSGLMLGSSGHLLGETYQGADNNNGLVFQLTPSAGGTWTENSAVNFRNGTDGDSPQYLMERNGTFYGTTLRGGQHGLGTAFELTPAGGGEWKENVIYSFNIEQSFDLEGISGLVADATGNLYGETFSGGKGSGLVFELSPGPNGWTNKNIYEFSGGADGRYPQGGLVIDAAGNLYGTTRQGGSAALGAVFKLTADAGGAWKESVLHNFHGYPMDGSVPYGGLVFDKNGNLYGTTSEGGSYGCVNTLSCGTVYELVPNSSGQWTETIMHSFAGGANDGGHPTRAPVLDQNGNLFGSTLAGGDPAYCGFGCGTAYELSPSGTGWNFTLLYSFLPTGKAGYPASALVMDAVGNLYGTTNNGGGGGWCLTGPACGAAFELSSSSGEWKVTNLHSFGAFDGDGVYPQGVILGSDGNLFGTASYGGLGQSGVVFEIVLD
jgi:uncharacterized repeat protein (TIGR03803 family)